MTFFTTSSVFSLTPRPTSPRTASPTTDSRRTADPTTPTGTLRRETVPRVWSPRKVNRAPISTSQSTFSLTPHPFRPCSRLSVSVTSSLSVCRPSEHDGKTKDGKDDKRMSSDHGFGSAEGADPHSAGKKGGESSYENGRLTT